MVRHWVRVRVRLRVMNLRTIERSDYRTGTITLSRWLHGDKTAETSHKASQVRECELATDWSIH